MSTEAKVKGERKKKVETNTGTVIDEIDARQLLQTDIKPLAARENTTTNAIAKSFNSIYPLNVQEKECLLDGASNKRGLVITNQFERFGVADKVCNNVKQEKSIDALEKCIEWLSYHPTEAYAGHGNKEQTRREIQEYRQKAVRQWVNRIPEESESDKDEQGSGTMQTGQSQVDILTAEVDCTAEAESDDEDNGLVSHYILSKLPTYSHNNTSNRACEKTKDNKYENERDPKNKDPLGNACSWLIHRVLGKCWKKHINEPANSTTKRDTEEHKKTQDLGIGASCDAIEELEDRNARELSSGEVFSPANTSTDAPGRNNLANPHAESNSDEILRLTSLLQNTPKSTMRMKSIFSLRKERILPEKQTPPSVFTRVGKQMKGFIANRLGIGSINQSRGNRFNRINPYNHSRVTRVSTQVLPQPAESSQSSNWHRIVRVLSRKKPSVNTVPTPADTTNNPTFN